MKTLYGAFQKGMNWLTDRYAALLRISLNNRLVTLVVAVCILFISFAMSPTLQINMMPSGSDDSVTLNVTMPVGTPLKETGNVLLDLEKIVKEEVKGYKNITTSIGSSGRNSATNKGSIEISLPETKAQIDNAAAIQQKLRAHFNDYPGVTFGFGAGFRHQLTGSDIDIAIRSDDLDKAMSVAEKIGDIIDKLEDTGEASISMDKGLPQVEIVIDRQRAYSFGVDVTTVAKEINYAINGTTACVYRSNGKDYNVVVSYRPEDRKTMDDLESIFVNGTNGKVSVANFASLRKGVGPVSIARENQTRIIHVKADILTTTNANVVENMIKDEINNTFIGKLANKYVCWKG